MATVQKTVTLEEQTEVAASLKNFSIALYQVCVYEFKKLKVVFPISSYFIVI